MIGLLSRANTTTFENSCDLIGLLSRTNTKAIVIALDNKQIISLAFSNVVHLLVKTPV